MSGTRFTPGPWTIERVEGSYANIGIRVRGQNVSGYCAFVDTKWARNIQCLEQEANARLIAAAPDMYEALKSARATILELKNARWSEAEGADAEWVKDIDAALTNAGE